MNHLHGHPPGQDEDYIRRIQHGGFEAEHALKELYMLHRTSVKAYLHKLIRRFPDYKGQPEDLLHDSFIVLMRRVRHEDYAFHSIPAYWKGIGRMLFLNQLKKDERLVLVEDPEEMYNTLEEPFELPVSEPASHDLLRHSFDQLGHRCREILLLWVNDFTMQEITDRMDLSSIAMARKIKHECFKKLKNLVKSGNK